MFRSTQGLMTHLMNKKNRESFLAVRGLRSILFTVACYNSGPFFPQQNPQRQQSVWHARTDLMPRMGVNTRQRPYQPCGVPSHSSRVSRRRSKAYTEGDQSFQNTNSIHIPANLAEKEKWRFNHMQSLNCAKIGFKLDPCLGICLWKYCDVLNGTYLIIVKLKNWLVCQFLDLRVHYFIS